MARTNAARRRRRHPVPPPASVPPAAMSPTVRRLALAIVLPAAIGLSGLNIRLRLWSSAESWWAWLLGGSFLVATGIIVWFLARPEDLDTLTRRGLAVVCVALPLVSIGAPTLRHGGYAGALPDPLQAAAAAGVMGIGTGWAVMAVWGRIWPDPPDDHEVFVDLYANPAIEWPPPRWVRVIPFGFLFRRPLSSDGYYQARCRCGWQGPQRNIDIATAEADANEDRHVHLAHVGGQPDTPQRTV